MLRFPLWLLTGAVLAESIVATLVCKYEHEAPWYEQCNARRKRGRRSRCVAQTHVKERTEKAEVEAEGVLLDLIEALTVKEVRSAIVLRTWTRLIWGFFFYKKIYTDYV